jgi:fumarate hydratase class II
MPIELVHAFAVVKKAAALTNTELGVLSADKAALIVQVCDEICAGELDAHFPLVVWQTGSGTQTNMNLNEVIANRAQVLAGRRMGEDEPVLAANDEVNRSQSSNDTFPTAMHVAGFVFLKEHTVPALRTLQQALAAQSEAMMQVVKIGRTHVMDATPLTLGQEFSGYAAQLNDTIGWLESAMSSLLPLALGGTAVGTGLNAPDGFAEKVAEKIAGLTGYNFVSADNKFSALAAHDAVVRSHAALKGVAVALMKIAGDIRLLGSGPRAGIGELVLPANEPGSSGEGFEHPRARHSGVVRGAHQ